MPSAIHMYILSQKHALDLYERKWYFGGRLAHNLFYRIKFSRKQSGNANQNYKSPTILRKTRPLPFLPAIV